MSRVSLPSPHGLARKLYGRMQAMREGREDASVQTRMHADPGAPELLLSPHWDDAVLDCWSLLASDRELTVVNLFAGVPAPGQLTDWDEVTGAADSAGRARERIAEDAVALARAGRKPLSLPLLDGQYRLASRDPGLDELDLALIAHVQRASRVYVPAGIGAHADHVLARRYGRMLMRAGIPVTLYAELPYCIAHGWPWWVDGRAPDRFRNVDAFWSSFLESVPEMPALQSADVVHLDGPTASAKLEAMLCYATQFPCLDYGARQLLADPAIHGFEVRWELLGQGATGGRPRSASVSSTCGSAATVRRQEPGAE